MGQVCQPAAFHQSTSLCGPSEHGPFKDLFTLPRSGAASLVRSPKYLRSCWCDYSHDLLPEFAEVRYDTIKETDGERAERSQNWREKNHSEMDDGEAQIPWSPRNRKSTPPRARPAGTVGALSVETGLDDEGSEDDPLFRN